MKPSDTNQKLINTIATVVAGIIIAALLVVVLALFYKFLTWLF